MLVLNGDIEKPEDKSFAWVFEQPRELLDKGVTKTLGGWTLETEKRIYSLTDVPLHKDFVKDMIHREFLADCGILVVSAARFEFEEGMAPKGG